jgi:hypothetical protein
MVNVTASPTTLAGTGETVPVFTFAVTDVVLAVELVLAGIALAPNVRVIVFGAFVWVIAADPLAPALASRAVTVQVPAVAEAV